MEEVGKTNSDGPEVLILFFAVSLLTGVLCRYFLHGTRVPYTVAVFVTGIGLGTLEFGTNFELGILGTSVRLWAEINPDLILFVFLPPLLFESTFFMEFHKIKRCLVQMVLLAGPGVVISTFSIGTAIHMLFPFGWNWATSLLLGGLLSATDPLAVVALLKELGISKKLSTIIEGESLMNDGVAIVIFSLFFQTVLGQTFNVAKVINFLSHVCFGAIALGLTCGFLSILWLCITRNDIIIDLTLTFTVSYIAYFVAEDGAKVSGVLTVTTLGILFSAIAKLSFKGGRQQIMHNFWEMVAYVANTLIFILSGVLIAESIHRALYDIPGYTWGYLMLLYTFLQLSRIMVVAMLYPGLKYFGYGLDWKEAIILVWAGLRGAVALALSLSVRRASDNLISQELSKKTGALFVFFTGGVVFLTLILNGTTTQFLLHLVRKEKETITKVNIADHTKYKMNSMAFEAFGKLEQDLGPMDWPSVIKYTTCLNSLQEQEKTHPHYVFVYEDELRRVHVQDIRLRLLTGVQAAYCRMLEEERITQTSAILLMQSIDEALDLAISHETLLDWKGLSAHVCFPDYVRYLQLRFFPEKLVTFLTVKKLELGCYICAAFLEAHKIAQRQLLDFIGESEVVEIVIQESEAEGEAAKQFLEDVQLTFPQVLHAIKTKQVTHSTLMHLSEYVQNLEKIGLLEQEEMSQLHNAVQTDLKKLGKNPPLVEMPTVSEILDSHPLLRALPSTVRETLGNSAKMMMKLRGNVLYKEGSKPDGIWLIANGVVKCSSKHFADSHLLHPTFSCGSTLGLYEILTGKPCLCVLAAESAVHCFFIETTKVLSAIQMRTAMEDIFWQESVAIVAKMVLPQQFGGMSMQDLRAIVIEQSTMHTFIRGELIEIPSYDVGILLEGFVRETRKKDFVEAPASLFPLNAEHHLIRRGISTSLYHHKPSWFRAETRSRVIIFNLRKVNMMSNNSEGLQIKNLGSSSTFPTTYSEKKFHMHRRPRSEVSINIDGTMKPLKSRGVRGGGETSREGPINVEDDHIVRIDSPKSLHRRQFSL